MRPHCSGFTLVETLVALAIAGSVFLPATLLMHRLLAENRRLDADVAASLRQRETPVAFPSPDADAL
jgi:prepilin-type N-terminal cleavage/methylation domain-containing protein